MDGISLAIGIPKENGKTCICYAATIGNYESIEEYYQNCRRILYKWLNRRSQRRSFNWSEFRKTLDRYQLMRPRITESRGHQLVLKFDFI